MYEQFCVKISHIPLKNLLRVFRIILYPNWDALLPLLERASRKKKENDLRRATAQAFKRWFWFNSIDVAYFLHF